MVHLVLAAGRAGITPDIITVEARKFGEVLSVKFDRKRPSSAWVTFKHKAAARGAKAE